MTKEKKNSQNLNLPQTDFSMKAQLKKTEPHWIQFWKKKQIYQKLLHKQDGKPSFCLIDGPPYANGRLHIGHALNKILKDMTVKYANLSGKYCPFIPIWDCHGLPIEMAVLKRSQKTLPQEGLKKGDFIRKACRKEALYWVEVQKKEFESLGVLADWDHPLLTLNPEYEAQQLRAFSEIAKKGLIYRGKKPVYWCCALQTAIASSEVEYRLHTSPSIYVKFPTSDVAHFLNLGREHKQKPCFFAIWTTTPWTLPANQAICLKKNLSYGLFDSGKELLILAEKLKEDFQKNTGLSLKLVQSFLGEKLEYQKAKHPLMNQDSLIILGDHVTTDEGTGCVHTAPGHGLDDFTVGTHYQLPIKVPVSANGQFTSEVPQWEGMSIFKANPLIIEALKKKNCLLKQKTITHNYPFNPRANSPLIFRATHQWFISLDHSTHPVRKKALQEIQNNIQFVPLWGKQRLNSMIRHSPDWCLSRQRHWGVPIPVFYCTHCEYPLLDPQIIHHIADQMEQSQQGIEYWFSHNWQSLLPQPMVCPKCQKSEWKKGSDILDVWFDSGICHFVYQKKYPQFFPADIYLEGSDQHRGWFQTSLNSSICLHNKAPFKTLLTHCFINDAKGYKMSKSKGNVVDLQMILQQRGADIIRLWVSSEDYSQDLQISHEILDRVTETYRRLRNTIRFMLGNLFDFTPQKSIKFSEMKETDQWILNELATLTLEVKSHYTDFSFHKIYQKLNVFFTNTLSSLYLDILKDRLYTFKKECWERRSAQTAIYYLLKNLLSLMSPITTFLSEDAYQHLPNPRKESILLEDFPTPPKEWMDPSRIEKFKNWLSIRKKVYFQMELMRKNQMIGSSLETQVTIHAPPSLYIEINNSKELMKEWLIVSQLTVQKTDHLKITVQKANGQKCKRCWHYSEQLNNQEICRKCVKNQ